MRQDFPSSPPSVPPPSTLHQQDARLVQIVDAALADATRRAGSHLACRPGCTQCCHGAFAINPLDALRLRSAIDEMRATHPERAAAVSRRARQYLAEFGPQFPGNPTTGILGSSPEEESAFEDFANEAPCPALNPENGLCDLYEARPMTCRVFGPPVRMDASTKEPSSDRTDPQTADLTNSDAEQHSGLAVCDLCFTTATPEEIEAAEMTVPHAEEKALLDQMPHMTGNTIVAYCLTPPSPSQS